MILFSGGETAVEILPLIDYDNIRRHPKLFSSYSDGTLIDGYISLFGLMLTNEHFKYNTDKKYVLFLEDHEKFSGVGAVSTYLAFIGQSKFIHNVVGLIFGHYSLNVPNDLLRFGKNHNIPIVYTDDFGHGTKHAILPIGVNANLDADNHSLAFSNVSE